MKKICLILLASLLLTGCVFNKVDDDPQVKYQDFLQLLVNQENYQTASIYYDINAEMVKTQENEYRYYVFIDNPSLAMYDIQTMVVETTLVNDPKIMSPSAGILDHQIIHMVPNQDNIELGFSKGIALSGVKSFEPDEKIGVELRVMIQWFNEDRSKQTREFIMIQYNHVQGADHDDSDIEEPTPTPTPDVDKKDDKG